MSVRLYVRTCVSLYLRMSVSVCPCVRGSVGQYVHTFVRRMFVSRYDCSDVKVKYVTWRVKYM